MEIHYSQGSFNADDLIKYLNLTARGDTIYYELIKSREVIKKAEALSLKVSADDLQAYVDKYRIARGLQSKEETLQFLSQAGLTVDDLEQFCEMELLTEAVKDHLANEAKIETHFIKNRTTFDMARISRIIVETENLANEIIMQVSEEGKDFYTLARTHSLDNTTKFAGGYEGFVSRSAFSPNISSKVFNAKTNEVIGPFKFNNVYQLILVEELIKPKLDDRLKSLIRDNIFDDWASQFIQGGIHYKWQKSKSCGGRN